MNEKYQAANDNFEDVSTTENVVYSDKLTRRNYVLEVAEDALEFIKHLRLDIKDRIGFIVNSEERESMKIDLIEDFKNTSFSQKDIEFERENRRNLEVTLINNFTTLELLNNKLSILLSNLTEGSAVELQRTIVERREIRNKNLKDSISIFKSYGIR